MPAHRRDALRAPGPRAPRTSAAVVALGLLAFATLVVVYRDAGALRGAVRDSVSGSVSGSAGDPVGDPDVQLAAARAAQAEAVLSASDADEKLLAIDKTQFQSTYERQMILVPPGNLWDSRRPSASERQLEHRLLQRL